MENNVLSIQKNYNDAINICYTYPNSYISATNPTICSVEQMVHGRKTVGERVRALHSERELAAGIQLSSDEDEIIEPMYKTMCGCRLTTRIIFVMLLLCINEPIGPEFMWIYGKLLHHNINNTIMRGLNVDKLSGIVEKDYYINESLEEISDLFIVQILKRVNRRVSMYDLVPAHSFIVIMYPDRSCGVISSWYGGFDDAATPIIYNKISFEELRGVLTPEGLINKEYTDILFGKGNNLEGDLKTIFISKEAIIYRMEFAGIEFPDCLELGGGGGRRKRTRRKTRRKNRRKTSKKS